MSDGWLVIGASKRASSARLETDRGLDRLPGECLRITVAPDGFLDFGGLDQVPQGTLAETLTLTIRARLQSADSGGDLGFDGRHRGLLGGGVRGVAADTRFGWSRGRRHFPGWWWPSTADRHVLTVSPGSLG